jgi:hypothetical protein
MDVLTSVAWPDPCAGTRELRHLAGLHCRFDRRTAGCAKKLSYLKRHWLVVISVAVPAVRVLRFARLARGGGRCAVCASFARLTH